MSTNPIFSEIYLDKQRKAAEKFLTKKFKILFRRTPINIVNGVAEYDLPEGLVDLVDIKYKGKTLLPYSTLIGREASVLSFINKNQKGTPLYYILKEVSYKKVRLWPTPNENLTANESTINLSSGISSQCIISYYRISDENNLLPPFLRRRLTKYYIMKYAYLKEGDSQDIKASQYFDEKLNWSLQELDDFIRLAYSPKFNAFQPAIFSDKQRIARPVLPPMFGESR
ncbi:MAG: phage adaptor protein [Bacteroidales bacterium]